MENINIYKYSRLSQSEILNLCKRAESNLSDYFEIVDQIIKNVEENKENALIEYSKKLDNVKSGLREFKVSEEEFSRAHDLIDEGMKEALIFCSANVKKFHEAQMPKKEWMIEMHPGVLAGEKNLPIESVALYVPRGKGSFPSVAMMTSIPAVIAGVNTPVIFTPPEEDGTVDCATLVAAEIAGVKNVFKIGGAQAVAAAAFGTDTVPKCLKIVGPGSPWVAAAKSRLSHVIDTGTPAGPSEAIVFADQSANGKLVALDLLIESEHGSDSSVYLISNSITVIQEAKDFIPQCFQNMTQERVKYATDVLCGRRGGIIQVDNTDQALDFINLYAPEHLQIHSKNPDQYLDNIKNAGEIMLGEFSPMSIANFSLGPNNVIPTNAWAKTKSPLSVHDFIKSTSIGKIDNKGFSKLSPYAKKFAEHEGFDAHANAVSQMRLDVLKK